MYAVSVAFRCSPKQRYSIPDKIGTPSSEAKGKAAALAQAVGRIGKRGAKFSRPKEESGVPWWQVHRDEGGRAGAGRRERVSRGAGEEAGDGRQDGLPRWLRQTSPSATSAVGIERISPFEKRNPEGKAKVTPGQVAGRALCNMSRRAALRADATLQCDTSTSATTVMLTLRRTLPQLCHANSTSHPLRQGADRPPSAVSTQAPIQPMSCQRFQLEIRNDSLSRLYFA